jgi:endonuclease/exonuclease/phosphatase (EEP) superfamily protein YafD
MTLTLVFFTAFIVLATLLPLWRNPHWSVRGFDFPRLQIAVVASLVIVFQLALLDWSSIFSWLLIAATGLCLASQLWRVLPYTLLWRKEVKSAATGDSSRVITIMTSNVLTPNRNAGALIALVKQHQPDVLVTLESDQWWEDQLAVLDTDMPFSVKCPLDNLYGMHVFSRLPLHEAEKKYLVEDGVPSVHGLVELRSGDKVRIHFVHPAPPSPSENEESSERDAELIIVARSVADDDQPTIVTGDLNDVAWSPTTQLFRKISGLLDPRVGRGMFSTFHAKYFFMRWPLDHLFHSEHFDLKGIRRLPDIGSDHFPLLTGLVYVPNRRAEPETPDADSDERIRAGEIAREEGVSKQDVPEPGK